MDGHGEPFVRSGKSDVITLPLMPGRNQATWEKSALSAMRRQQWRRTG
jgi:hypothetical protein